MIPEDIVRRIRESVEIAVLVGETVKLQRRGRSLVGLCPFHKEKTPSFHVNPERNFWMCFGCRDHGSAVDFLMKIEGLTFREALERLAERAGIVITDDGRKPAPGQGEPGKDLYEANAVAAAYYESQLQGSRVALAELQARGLSSDQGQAIRDALSAFRVGYAPAGWDGLAAHLQANGISPLAGEKTGLLLPRKTGGGYYDRFRNRLMFAILDVQGRIVGFSGRILPDPTTGQIDKTSGKYVNSPECAIYRKGDVAFGLFQARQAIRAAGHAVLVEGNFDVLALHARGFTNVVAPLGTAFTPMQVKLIKRFSPKLVLMFDGDSAGLDATRKALHTVVDAGLEASVAVLPTGWDPDAFVRDCGEDGMREILASPCGLIEHLVDQDLDGFSHLDVQGRVARLRNLLTMLGSISDEAVRSAANTYVDGAVAKATDDSIRTLDALRQELAAKARKAAPRATSKKPALPMPVALSLKMLGCLIDQPDLLDDDEVQQAIGQSFDGDLALAAAQIRRLSSGGADAFIEAIPERVRRFAASRIACPRCEGLGSARAMLLSCSRVLQTGNRVEENSALIRELQEAPTEDEKVSENLSRLYDNMVQGQHTR